MKKAGGALFTVILLNAVKYWYLAVGSIVFMIIGSIMQNFLLKIGFILLILFFVAVLFSVIQYQKLYNAVSDDDSEFAEMLEQTYNDPRAFVAESVEEQERLKNMHGEDLLVLPYEDLYDAIVFQCNDIISEAQADEDNAHELFSGARRVFYILAGYDTSIQCGGLYEFFNDYPNLAPLICENLRLVGADDHRELFENFITENNIDVNHLESFHSESKREEAKQRRRFDYDSFDEKYCDLPELLYKIIPYVRENINEF